MTMVFMPEGLLFTATPFSELAAMNKTDGKVDVTIWVFDGATEEAAQKRAIFNSWFLAVMKSKFKEPEYPSKFEPDSRYQVLPEELEQLVLENIDDDGGFDGCPGPNQDYADLNEVVFHWAAWILYRLLHHRYIGCGFDDDWTYFDREAGEAERGFTQEVQRREAEEAYRAYLASRPSSMKQKLMLTAKPAMIRQMMDFISLMNRNLKDRHDLVEFEPIDTVELGQRDAASR
jgi:hypothetical protein